MPFMRDRLKKRRLDMGLTLEEVGNVLNISRSAVQKHEKGVIKNVYTSTVELFAQALRCSPAYLMGWTDNPSITPNTVDLKSDEFSHIEKYRSLNSDGKKKLAEYADDLISSGKYIGGQNQNMKVQMQSYMTDRAIAEKISTYAESDSNEYIKNYSKVKTVGK